MIKNYNNTPTDDYKLFADTVVVYIKNQPTNVIVGNEIVEANHVFIKSDTQKSHHAAEKWMGKDGTVVTLPNNFSEAYIIQNVYDNRTTNTVMKLLLKTERGNFIVDMYVPNYIRTVVGKIGMDNTGKLSSPIKLVSGSLSYPMWVDATTVAKDITVDKPKKVKQKDLVIGGVYSTPSRYHYSVYLGKNENGEFRWLSSEMVGSTPSVRTQVVLKDLHTKEAVKVTVNGVADVVDIRNINSRFVEYSIPLAENTILKYSVDNNIFGCRTHISYILTHAGNNIYINSIKTTPKLPNYISVADVIVSQGELDLLSNNIVDLITSKKVSDDTIDIQFEI